MYRIYATTTCSVCKLAAKYLEDRGLPYEYKLIDKDIEAKNELYELEPHVRMVPRIYKGPELVGSFNDLKELLEA